LTFAVGRDNLLFTKLKNLVLFFFSLKHFGLSLFEQSGKKGKRVKSLHGRATVKRFGI